MNTELGLISAFAAGLFGSLHCIAMCGGIAGTLSLGVRADTEKKLSGLLPYLLAYNLGRLGSYMSAGLAAGFLGAQFVQYLPMDNPRTVAAWVSGLFMIALGLYIGAWWQALTFLEKAGGYWWRRIEPLSKYFLPVRTPLHALGAGLVWGWLPCGLVYSILAFALASANPLQGASLMLAFGLGTLPMLAAIGAAARRLNRITKEPALRRTAGAMLIAFGLFVLFGPAHHAGHSAKTAESGHVFGQHRTPMPERGATPVRQDMHRAH